MFCAICNPELGAYPYGSVAPWVNKNEKLIIVIEFALLITGVVLSLMGSVWLADYPEWTHTASVLFSLGVTSLLIPLIIECTLTSLIQYEIKHKSIEWPSIKLPACSSSSKPLKCRVSTFKFPNYQLPSNQKTCHFSSSKNNKVFTGKAGYR